MWSREGLVKIQVDNVETHVAGPDLSEYRVEVCPVVVEQSARLMDYHCDLENVPLEDSQSVRIRNHKSSRVRTRQLLQFVKVDHPFGVRWDNHHLEPSHSCTRRVCAVRRVWHNHLRSPLQLPP